MPPCLARHNFRCSSLLATGSFLTAAAVLVQEAAADPLQPGLCRRGRERGKNVAGPLFEGHARQPAGLAQPNRSAHAAREPNRLAGSPQAQVGALLLCLGDAAISSNALLSLLWLGMIAFAERSINSCLFLGVHVAIRPSGADCEWQCFCIEILSLGR